MDLLVVKFGHPDEADPVAAQLRSYGDHGVTAAAVPAGQDPTATADDRIAALDTILDRRDDRRLAIDADLPDLNLVLHRLQRRGELATVETAVIGPDPGGYLAELGVPRRRADRLGSAVTGVARLVGVIKDDSGGLCLDSARLTPWPIDTATERSPAAEAIAQSAGWWVRAVVDDQRLCDGEVRELTVRRTGPNSLSATVRFTRLRSRTCTGRSLQLACDPAQIVADGIGRTRPRGKRTFFSEPTLWNLVLPGAN